MGRLPAVRYRLVSGEPFISYAQNGEDVVLWRALGHVSGGTYVDVGAAHPSELSVTRALYERGWRGIDVEPVSAWADLLEEQRPRDVVVRALAGSQEGVATLHQIDGTGLSTVDAEVAGGHEAAGFEVRLVERPVRRVDALVDEHLPGRPLHLLKIDVEGAEADVLASVDLSRIRPWVIVVEATAPLSPTPTYDAWEPALLAQDYRFCLFDGISRFYVAAERTELMPALSYPACALDEFETVALADYRVALAAMEDTALNWRAQALVRAAEVSRVHRAGHAGDPRAEAENRLLHEEVEWLRGLNEDMDAQVKAIAGTLSWRVTRPLRVLNALKRRRAASNA